MSGAVPAIGVVVVTYNSGTQIGTCLDSLHEGCAGVDLVAVVVADNSSTDDTVAVAHEPRPLPIRVVQLGRNVGYAAGVNAGIEHLPPQVDAVLVLNPDITVHPGSVARLAGALGRPGCAIAVPKLLNPDGTLQPSLRRMPTLGRALAEAVFGGRVASRLGPLGELITDPVHYGRPGPATWATGGAMMISLRAAVDIGPWDETLLLYGEETEYALRAADQGWGLWYEPTSVMDHVGGTQTVTNASLFALLTVNRVRVFRRRHGRIAGAAYYAAVTLGEVIRAAAGRRTARAAIVALVRPSRRLRALPG